MTDDDPMEDSWLMDMDGAGHEATANADFLVTNTS